MKITVLALVVLAIVGSIAYLEFQKPMRVGPADTAGGGALSEEVPLPSIELPVPQDKAAGEVGVEKEKGAAAASPKFLSFADKAKLYSRAKEISTPDGFINTDRVSVGEFVGKKAVLLDIWTYSCINCQRTIPYLNAWQEKYKDKGLVIIGLHTPEFEFEQKYDNVLAAVKKFGVQYPVVLDNDYSTWTAYGNRYWPRKYLIDIDGFVVYDHIGEGAYEETEKKIQEVLAERMARLGEKGAIASGVAQPNAPAVDPSKLGSPEVYFGASRNEYLGNGKQGTLGLQAFQEPLIVFLNKLYLAGDWNIEGEFAENRSASAKIIFRYKAKNVYIVGSAASSVKITVLRDGKPLGSEAGEDVHDGTLTVQEDRLYKLIEDSSYGEHTLELLIENPGLRAFTFTFG